MNKVNHKVCSNWKHHLASDSCRQRWSHHCGTSTHKQSTFTETTEKITSHWHLQLTNNLHSIGG